MRLFVWTILVLFVLPVSAQHLYPVSLNERVNNASLIVEGKVIAQESSWDDARQNIYTVNTIQVTALLKGALPFSPRGSATEVQVLSRGGQVGMDLEIVVPTLEMSPGESGVFTLEAAPTAISGYGSLYRAYAGPQGFIKYDPIEGIASDPFNTYASVERDLLNAIEGISGQRIGRDVFATVTPTPMLAISSSATISSFSPAIASAGTATVLTINGSGFGSTQSTSYVEFEDANYGGSGVYVSPIAAQYISWSDTKIELEIPYRSGTGNFRVSDGTNTVYSPTNITIDYNAYTIEFASNAEPIQLKNNDGIGGYTFQMYTDFAADPGASTDFIDMVDSWVCSTGVPWTIGANATLDATADDGMSIIRFDSGGELPAGALGVTTSRLSVCSGKVYIREIDMSYSLTVSWNHGTGSPGGSEYDFRSTVIHELGHGHGLGHVITSGSVMFYALANGTQDRTLSNEDVDGGDWIIAEYTNAPSCSFYGPILSSATAPVPDLALLDTIVGGCGVNVTVTPTATDNCDGSIAGTTTDPLTYSASGQHLITWSYADLNGNTVTQGQIVEVTDVTAPVPDVGSLSTITSACSVTAAAPTATDDCGGTITATTPGGLTYSQDTTIVWTYMDAAGNSVDQSQSIVISDAIAPVPDVSILSDLMGDCNFTVSTFPTASDNCLGTITATTTDTLYYDSPGVYSISWEYTDADGNDTTQSQSVVISDVNAPVADVSSLPAASGDCSLTLTPPTATDACDGSIVATTTDSTSFITPGTRTILWRYEDAAGNIDSQMQTATVADVTPPVKDIATLPNVFGECSAVAAAPSATDNCNGAIVGTTTDPTSYSTQGIHTINWTYTDVAGNSSSQIQYVLVADVSAPIADVASLPDVTGDCSATITTVPTATDNCFGIVVGTTSDSLTYDVAGTHTVTWQFVDSVGNASQQLQQVVITDGIAPVADSTSLSDLTGTCSVTATPPTASDNCDGTIIATTADGLTHTSSTTISWSFEDAAGNVVTQSQNVIISDGTNPVPDVSTLPDLTAECSLTVPSSPTAIDNCDGALDATTTDTTYYDSPGSYTINWTYTDASGNSSAQTQTVIIADVSAPIPNISTLPTVTGDCTATAFPPTATDVCDGGIVATTTDPLTYSTPGSHTINWTYTDAAGNSSSQTQMVLIADVNAPVADNATLPILNGECSVTVATIPSATDACDGAVVATTTDPLSYSTAGSHSINWTYIDASGNSSSQIQTVVIADVTDPVADVSTLSDIIGDCSVSVSSAPTASDNCDGTVLGTTTDPLAYSMPGAYTINWSYTDAAGNSRSQTQNVIVRDTLAPVADSTTFA